jgi:hypothetical protein
MSRRRSQSDPTLTPEHHDERDRIRFAGHPLLLKNDLNILFAVSHTHCFRYRDNTGYRLDAVEDDDAFIGPGAMPALSSNGTAEETWPMIFR